MVQCGGDWIGWWCHTKVVGGDDGCATVVEGGWSCGGRLQANSISQGQEKVILSILRLFLKRYFRNNTLVLN